MARAPLAEHEKLADVSAVSISAVRTHRVTAALRMPFVTALRRTTTVESLLVEIVDDEGHAGWGEAPQVWRVTGESIAGAEACVAGPLSEVLDGRDPADLQALLVATRAAVFGNHVTKAAVDVALHDLAARRLGVPLPGLLGGTTRSIQTDVTLSAGNAEALATTAAERVGDGFDVLKVKVGADADHPLDDVVRVRAVRDAVGSSIGIRLDANQAWSPRAAVGVIRALEDADLGIDLIEQPVSGRDVEGLGWVSDRVDTPVLADEAVFGVNDLVEVIRRHAADLINVKLAKCGGLGPARTLLELSRAHGLGTMVGSMMEGPVGVGAAASLVAAYDTTVEPDLDAAWWLAEPPIVGGARYATPYLLLPDAPGLGIEGLRH